MSYYNDKKKKKSMGNNDDDSDSIEEVLDFRVVTDGNNRIVTNGNCLYG